MADNDPVPPDLQEWIRRYGGYTKINWKAWDHANVEYQAERAALYLRERIASRTGGGGVEPKSKPKKRLTG